MTAQQAWLDHKRTCRRCQRQWRRWKDGEMTCETGVGLFFAAMREDEEMALFTLEAS